MYCKEELKKRHKVTKTKAVGVADEDLLPHPAARVLDAALLPCMAVKDDSPAPFRARHITAVPVL